MLAKRWNAIVDHEALRRSFDPQRFDWGTQLSDDPFTAHVLPSTMSVNLVQLSIPAHELTNDISHRNGR
jgi:hypothetical protein